MVHEVSGSPLPEEDVREKNTVQAQEYEIANEPEPEKTKKGSPQSSSESDSLFMVLARLAINLTLFTGLLLINLGAALAFVLILGGGVPSFVDGNLVITPFQLSALISAIIVQFLSDWATRGLFSAKPKSSDTPKTDVR